MKSHEIYGLPETATAKEISDAAAKHMRECAQGMHGTILPTRSATPQGMVWSQSQSEWIPDDKQSRILETVRSAISNGAKVNIHMTERPE